MTAMNSRGELRIDPGTIQSDGVAGELEVVVPYTGERVTRTVLERALALTAGLQVRILLLAVHAIPYPSDFCCPTSVHNFLVEELAGLASRYPLPIDAQVVLARDREEGFRHALQPDSTVLIGSPKRIWRTPEEKLARRLAHDGHKVALVHI